MYRIVVLLSMLVCTSPAIAGDTLGIPMFFLDIPLGEDQMPGVTSLSDINDAGQQVGNIINGPLAFVVTHGQVVPYACPESLYTSAQSINNHGDITGWCYVQGRLVGYIRDASGAITLIEPPDAILTELSGINDAGQLVGDYRDTNGTFHGLFWAHGQHRRIDMPGATSTILVAINNWGEIVGGYIDQHGRLRGLYVYEESFQSIEVPGALDTIVLDINDRGRLLVLAISAEGRQATYVMNDGKFQAVVLPIGQDITEGSGLNNHGHIVGRRITPDPADPHTVVSQGFLVWSVPPPRPAKKTMALASLTLDTAASPPLVTSRHGCFDMLAGAGTLVPAKLSGRAIFCH